MENYMEIKELFQLLKNHDADFVSVVDVSEQLRPLDLPIAIIIGIVLSKQYLHAGEKIISVKGCCCCLKYMSHCPWTRKYAER